MLITFSNGLVVGATLNYALAHLLHLTPIETHFIATSLLATFRGFAGSFGSAVGGGAFARILRTRLELGGLNAELIRKLMGSPALVQQLSGWEKEVAVMSYSAALQGLFYFGAVLAVLMIAVQAAAGRGPPEEEVERQSEDGEDIARDVLDGHAPPVHMEGNR